MGIDILMLSLIYVVATAVGFIYGRKAKKDELEEAYRRGVTNTIKAVNNS